MADSTGLSPTSPRRSAAAVLGGRSERGSKPAARPSRWRRRLLNAFLLVATPAAAAVLAPAAYADGPDEGVVRLGTATTADEAYGPGKTGNIRQVQNLEDGSAAIQLGPPPAPMLDASPAMPIPAAPVTPLPEPGVIPPAEMPAPVVSPVDPGTIPPAAPSSGVVSSGPLVTGPVMAGPVTPGAIVGAPTTPLMTAEPGSSIGYAVTSDPARVLYNVGRRNGDILGLDEGFTSIGGFFPLRQTSPTSHTFFNPRAIITDQGRGAFNLGFGHRVFNPATNRTGEASLWYDYDDGHSKAYNQFGFHFASYGSLWTYRAGGNVILSDDVATLGTVGAANPAISGNNIVFDAVTLSEIAYNRFYGEAEVPLEMWNAFGGTFAVGAYYLDATDEAEESPGISLRAESQVTEDAWVNVLWTHDDIFDSQVSVNFNITIPDGRPSRYFQRKSPRDMLYSQTRRPYRVATAEIAASQPVVATNADGSPITVAFVDPNQPNFATTGVLASGGSGDAFGSLADFFAQDATFRGQFDAIFVTANDPTIIEETIAADGTVDMTARVAGQDLDAAITLLDGQSLIGDPGLGAFLANRLGITDLTGLDTTGLTRPLVTNSSTPGQDVITLIGGNHTVAGLQIDAGGTADGINAAAATGDFLVFDNVFTNFQRGLVVNHSGAGRGVVAGNLFDGNGVSLTGEDGPGFGSSDGILINHTGAQLDLLIADNMLVDIAGEDANSNGVIDPSEDLNGNGLLDTGEDRNGNGRLDLAEDVNGNGLLDVGRAITVVGTGVGTFINAGDPPVVEDPSIGDDVTLPVEPDVEAMLTMADGTVLTGEANGGFEGVGIFRNIIGDINAENAAGTGTLFGISVIAQDGATIELTQEDNIVVGGVLAAAGLIDPGFVLTADNARMDVFNFENNVALGVGGLEDGGQFSALNGGKLVFDDLNPETSAFDNNTFSSNGGNGLVVLADTGLVSFDAILNNNFGESDLSGDGTITPGAGGGTGTGTATTFQASIVDGTLLSGLVNGQLDVTGAALTSGVITGGQLLNAPDNLQPGQTVDIEISAADIALAGATTLPLTGSTVDAAAFQGTVIIDEVNSLAEGTTLNDGAGNLGDGLVLTALNGGIINVDQPLDGNVFQGNGGNGLTARVETGGQFTGNFGFTGTDADLMPITATNSFTGNLGFGISLQAGVGSVLNTTFENQTLTGNGGGLQLVADGGVINVASFQNNNLSANTEVGAEFVVNDGGTLTLPGMSNNDFSVNGEAGLRLTGWNQATGLLGTLTLGDVINNNFNRVVIDDTGAIGATVGFYGIEIDTEGVFINGVLTENSFIGGGAATGPGIGGVVDGGGLNLQLGTAAAVDRNVFMNNGDGHIALLLQGDSVNNVTIQKHILNGAVDSTDLRQSPLFDGVGVGFVLRDSARLSGFIADSQIMNNASDGVFISVSGLNTTGGPTGMGEFGVVDNFVIGGPGDATLDPLTANNIITGNQGAGIRLVRTANGQLGGTQILGNRVDFNGQSGLVIDLANTPTLDTIVARNNTFNNNGYTNPVIIDLDLPDQTDNNDGALIIGRADASANVVFDNNTFNENAGSGIETAEDRISAQDAGGIGGTWTNNEIARNREDGISIGALNNGLQIGLIGQAAGKPTFENGNIIVDNASDGIEVRSAGDLTIAGNLIARNGRGFLFDADGNIVNDPITADVDINGDGVIDAADVLNRAALGNGDSDGDGVPDLFDFDEDSAVMGVGDYLSQAAGIDIDAPSGSNIGIFQNDITDNRGDGIEWANATSGNYDLNVTSNSIDFNDGRGFDYLLRAEGGIFDGVFQTGGGAASDVIFVNNVVNSNRLQGMYLVMTSDDEQRQNVAVTEDLLRGADADSMRVVS